MDLITGTVYSPRPADCAAGPIVVGEALYENIAFSVVMGVLWEVTCRIIPGIVLPALYPPYSKLEGHTKQLWDVKLVNMLFAIIIVPMAYYCVNYDEALLHSPINGTSALVRLCSATAVGFFLWDTVICVKYLNDWGVSFLFHGLFCLTIFCQVAWFQITVAYALGALYYEASTPFLNIRWYMQQTKAYSHFMWQPMTVLFALSFFLVRIGYGAVHTWSILLMVHRETCQPLLARILSVTIILSSFGLNCKWAFDIIMSVVKVRKPKEADKKD